MPSSPQSQLWGGDELCPSTFIPRSLPPHLGPSAGNPRFPLATMAPNPTALGTWQREKIVLLPNPPSCPQIPSPSAADSIPPLTTHKKIEISLKPSFFFWQDKPLRPRAGRAGWDQSLSQALQTPALPKHSYFNY